MDLVYFIILVGVLIFAHELGHFAWARVFHVKVLLVSLGFGPRLLGVRRGETEYILAAIPLGGYVKMLGESPGDAVAPADAARSFGAQPVWKRAIVVVAGPAMSLAFPLLLHFVVALGDTMQTPSEVGIVFPDRPADRKLWSGDRIVAVDGEPISTQYQLDRAVAASGGAPIRLTLDRRGRRATTTITPAPRRRERDLDIVDRVWHIGVWSSHPMAVIGVSSASSPAATARLRTFDVVIAAGGRPVERWIDIVDALQRNRGTSVPLTYLRPVRLDGALGGLADLDIYEPRLAMLAPEAGEGGGLDRAGLEAADLYVHEIALGSPEHRMGLVPGDRIVSLDGRPIRLWATFIEDLRASRGRDHTLVWRRGEHELSGRFRLAHERGVGEHGQQYDRYVIGVRNWVPMRLPPRVPNPHILRYALQDAVRGTKADIGLTVYSVLRLLQGRLTVKSIGGPLAIVEVAGTAAREGALNYLALMAFISANLGLINLLPIPLLDGGHLLFLGVEAVRRRPLSMRTRQYGALVGLAVLVLLMVLAFKNDIERRWPDIIDAIEGTAQ